MFNRSLDVLVNVLTNDFIKHLKYVGDNKKKANELLIYFQDEINKSYLEKSGKEYELMCLVEQCFLQLNSDITEVKNITYETNHSIIINCLHNYILKNKCFLLSPQLKKKLVCQDKLFIDI